MSCIRFAILVGVILIAQEAKSLRLSADILDEAKRVILKEFVSMVEHDLTHDYMRDERYLIRFLDKTFYNPYMAKEYLHQVLKMREEEKVDAVLDEDWSDLEARFPYNLQMVNKEGRSVLYYNYGDWNVREAIENGEYDRLLRYVAAKVMEDAERKTRALRNGNEPLQFDILIDLEGYSTEKHGCLMCLRFYKALSDRTDLHYWGAVDRTYFINTPYIFEKAFNVIVATSSFVDWSKQSAFILGGKDSYGPVLADIIDLKQLPKNLQ